MAPKRSMEAGAQPPEPDGRSMKGVSCLRLRAEPLAHVLSICEELKPCL